MLRGKVKSASAVFVAVLVTAGAAAGQSVMGPSTPRLAPRAAGEPPRVKGEPVWTVEMKRAMERLTDSLDGLAYTGDVDADFAARVLPLRAALVELARVELRSGKDPETRGAARDLIQRYAERP